MFIGWRWPVGWLDFARHERKYEATQSSPMRPEILNPLFAALTDLKGVGPQLAKPLARLGLERVVDILFHLPTGLVQRHPVDRLDDVLKVFRHSHRMRLRHTGTASLRIRSRDPRGRLFGVSTSTGTPNKRSASICRAASVNSVVLDAGSTSRSRSLPS